MNVKAWSDRFELKKAPKLARVLTAFNANVDAMVFGLHQPVKALASLSQTELAEIEKKSDSELREIKSQSDFFSALLHCVKTGKAMHLHASQGVFDWMGSVFTADETRIGGQAGIMANQLSAFHDFVLTYSSLLSPLQASFFDQKVCFPSTSGKKLVCHPAKKVARKGDATKVNWIFEFKNGEKLKVKNEFHSPRSNRLIVSSPAHYTPIFENVDVAQLAKHAGVAMLSGFQQLHLDKNLGSTLKKISSQIAELKNANKSLVVHWEFVPMDDKKTEKQVLLSVGKAVDSMGLNEVEIADVLKALGAKKEADRLDKIENAYSLYLGGRKLLEMLKLDRVHLHSFGFQIAVLRNPYAVDVEKARDALVFSSVIAALKALKGSSFVSKKEFESHALVPSETGLNQIRALEGGLDEERVKRFSSMARRSLLESGIFELKDHYVIIVPSPIVQPKSTVGLGDVISSMALAAERG
ncbi:MAG TPA: ADP-dependent glucokinase/phosphofructokinase [Candidatus Norongarragalinales archaeon]|nr:ADP-dependent glucokinase/phosphofructokinase [Candidatus Norongarragalinales archaeon]